ncbi:MAG: N-acetylmuramate 1-kinase [Verrucomicrobiota bacterium]|jgi:aminoglycoside/choline kinase family phosphotransferase
MVATSSSIKTDALLRQTRIHFPRFDETEVAITPIEKGGSDRKFYRVRCAAEQTIILVKYDLAREENRHYVKIAEFLAGHDIRAPKIYFHDAAEGLIWIEDLGEQDLWSYRGEDWKVRRSFYESALDEIAKLHRLPESICVEMRQHLPAEFNAALYLWEQNYFFENCLGRYFGLKEKELLELAALPALQMIAHRLASRPRVLVHRDFQSQNIVMRDGQAYLIDFQGMRPGLPEYDLASLLYDPYVDLTGEQRDELANYYCERQRDAGIAVDDFQETLQLCAMQRLMQALGAYGFLGLVKGSESFLKFIPAATKSLHSIIQKHAGLEKLAEIIGKFSA